MNISNSLKLGKKNSGNQVTVEEVHETFFTEVDRLLEYARQMNSLTTDKQDLIDKCDRLKNLGFTSAKEVLEADKENARISILQAENLAKSKLIEAINYFTAKYPMYKFITKESVIKICEKYGLIHGDAQNYIGTIPDKNLKEIEEFKIDENDDAYSGIGRTSLRGFFGMQLTNAAFGTRNELENILKNDYNPDIKYEDVMQKVGLSIVAPATDFNTNNMRIENHQLVNIPDPIVLKPVAYKNERYYLIMTAWGEEASDEDVVNQNFN